MANTFNGWTLDSILAYITERMNNCQTFDNPDGYEHHFADGSTFRCVFASWKDKTPIKYYINGELVYQGTEF